ncbi:hypothetical protein TcBrA4_0102370 [Trypanosoma cruzi]|nr:hypothetical protein TcBrA4_0102370 [Trypanosoma cruzi]
MSETERTESCRILRSLVDLQLHGEDVRNSGRHRDRETVNKGYDKGATWTAGIEPDTLVLEAAIGPQREQECEFLAVGQPRALGSTGQGIDVTASQRRRDNGTSNNLCMAWRKQLQTRGGVWTSGWPDGEWGGACEISDKRAELWRCGETLAAALLAWALTVSTASHPF